MWMELVENDTVGFYDVCSVLCCHIAHVHKFHVETGVNKCLAVINDKAFLYSEAVRLCLLYLPTTQKRFQFSLNKQILSSETRFDMKGTKNVYLN